MIIGNTRDRRHDGSDDIGRIETTSHSHFYDSVPTSLFTKKKKCNERTSLEVREGF